jgi:hypothetical protein
MPKNLNKYLVVSYDPDQQQWFYDFVFAKNAETAEKRICGLRPYVVDSDATILECVGEMAKRLKQCTQTQSEAWLKELHDELDAGKEAGDAA